MVVVVGFNFSSDIDMSDAEGAGLLDVGADAAVRAFSAKLLNLLCTRCFGGGGEE